MNPWFTEMETNIVVRIKIVDVYKDLQTFHRLSGKMLREKYNMMDILCTVYIHIRYENSLF